MLRDLVKLVLTVPLIASVVGAFYCFVTAFRSLVNVAYARKDDVPLWKALDWYNIWFKPELYKPEARKWANLFSWCLIGMPFCMFAFVGIGLLMKAIDGKPLFE